MTLDRERLRERARRVRLLMLDVDGVLTDGRITFTSDGAEFKSFDVKDGHGIRVALGSGLAVAWASGRTSRVVEMRARELGVEELHQGVRDKLAVYEAILARHGLTDREVAYVGDDVVDLPPMRRAGLPVAVADALPAVKKAAVHVTEREGGRGAVREVIDLILEARPRVDREEQA